jgi:hypothetical protein
LNATGKESHRFDKDELSTLAEETGKPGFPEWVSRGLREQVADGPLMDETMKTEVYRFLRSSVGDDQGWLQDDPLRWSKVVEIHYPPLYMIYYVVDKLAEDGWVELSGTHFSLELANNAARKRAYNDNIPHRVRLVVWDG